MNLVWLKRDNISILSNRKIYIYGFGSMAKIVGRWLESNGIYKYFYCVDRRYVSSETICFEDCISDINSGTAVCLLGIGDAHFFNGLIKNSIISTIYCVFNPYEFWIYNDDKYRIYEDELKRVKSILADELSRNTLESYIKAMKTGDGKRQMEFAVTYGRYFNELTAEMGEGAYVDCGAYNGDTIDSFRNFYSGFDGGIYAFEPDKESLNILYKKYGKDPKISIIPKGVWNESKTLFFDDGEGERSEITDSGHTSIDVVSLDETIREKVAYIKIGVENAEVILNGARGIIEKDFPILSMLALYSFEDLYRLPLLIKTLSKGDTKYKVYLRHHSIASCGLLFYYAIPVNI